MPNIQIHELATASSLAPGDQLVVSTAAGQLTRKATLSAFPYVAPLAGAASRRLTDRLAESVSVRDFGAVGDGLADDTGAFNAAIASGARSVHLPAGTYRLTVPVQIPQRVALIGDGRDASFLHIDHDGNGLVWAAGEYVDGRIEGVCISLRPTAAGSGLRVQGNHFIASGLRIRGGAPQAWGIELDRCNDFHLNDVLMWGDAADAFLANGVWLRNATAAPVNYGDGSITQLSIRLGSANTKGIFFDGPNAINQIINNVLISKANIIAPGRAGCRAVHIRNARRLTFVSLDLESIDEGVVEEGSATDRTEMNQYIGVFALGVGVPYADSNASMPRSVFNRLFIGCDNFPALPGFADGDAFFQRGMWLGSWINGQPQVRLVESGAVCRVDKGGAAHVLLGPTSGNNAKVTCGVDGLAAPYDATLYLGDPSIRKVTVDAPLHMFERTGAPPMAQDQMIVFADGGSWNPGRDRGLYTRNGGVWHRLLDSRSKGWVAVNEQTGASYTLSAEDLGDVVEMTGSAAKTVTVPQFSTVPGASGSKAPGSTSVVANRKVQLQTTVAQVGAGSVTLAAAAGVTLTGPTVTSGDGQSLLLRWISATAVKIRLVT